MEKKKIMCFFFIFRDNFKLIGLKKKKNSFNI